MPGVNYETERGVLCCVDVAGFFSMISSIFNYFLVVAFSLWVWWRTLFIWTATSSWREACFTPARSSRMDDYLVLEGKASLKNYDIEGPASVISHISKNLKLFFEQFNAIFDHPGILSNLWGNSNFGPCGRRTIVGIFFQNYFIFILKPSLTGRYSG